MQRARLRELLDKTVVFKEIINLERLISDIDSKIVFTNQKLLDSKIVLSKYGTMYVNAWLEKRGETKRVFGLFDRRDISNEAREKIDKIISEDKEKRTIKTTN